MRRDRVGALEDQVARLEARVAELVDVVAVRDARIAELEESLGESRRAGKRQAAPFSKGDPTDEPARPGRKPGKAHGRHEHRRAPLGVDRTLEAGLPGCCGDCGGSVNLDRVADQWQVELPTMKPVVTRFRVQIGHCADCGKRVQGRHPEQTSDALGAAASQVGPQAKATAMWLHYGLGLSFTKCSRVLARLGVNAHRGGAVHSSPVDGYRSGPGPS